MTALDRLHALNVAHYRLCGASDGLRFAAWRAAEGLDWRERHRLLGIRELVETRIDLVDRRLGQLEDDWARAQEDR